ncbi:MAG: response regulator [Verrucomicrobiota bacterium]
MNTPDEILLVEDNPHDAELTIRALKSRNLVNNVVHVSDGQAAIDYLFGKNDSGTTSPIHNPKVVLLDLKLPKVDGIDVLRKIRITDRTKLLPVVVLTSSREDRDIIETYKLGANSYIVKPVDFEQFTEAVSALGMYWLLLNQAPVQAA